MTTFKKKIISFWKVLGPGLITGASDDDPSGIATYSQAGAQFGTKLLWTAIVTYPLMVSIQEMCARIGLVAGKGLMGTTISPYLFFWQASMEVEEIQQRHLVVDKRVIHSMQSDVRWGVLLFYILATIKRLWEGLPIPV